ncbi:STAS domain-containing protein [Pseudoduganella lurida]|uniref:STAS domain-containing protein n=1 Tax=Pseudoduganella lurida TaxID=1036180 RepID=A0A562R204_9BURK|nr:STAS domain-containing protein [Pseudoduganella lurida]TWI63105.1 STAS domain-containing protein [Pseudoduganella lurida]
MGYTERMGLFSLFRKTSSSDNVDADEAYARLAANSEGLRPDPTALDRQRDLARATVLKIDAIEAAMAADIFNEPEPAFRRPPRQARVPADDELPDTAVTELLDDDETPAEAAAAERAPLVEEAAILYANGQSEAAGELLAAGMADAGADRTAWWMLFDLYQAGNQQGAFDSLSIDYASTFETSPPPWNPAQAEEAHAYSGITPTAAIAGVLDHRAAAQVARIRELADAGPVLRLDFSRITAVEPDGCILLLEALRGVPAGHELILAGADELLALVRGLLDVGRRDEGEAPWLLWLELLRLLNREKAFEEASMDYCVTFEVSPPPFVAPGRVASAPRQAAAPAADRYLLPRTIEGSTAAVFAAIRDYAAQPGALVFDCSRLARIDFAAAGQLGTLLRELATDGRRVEFRGLNHLVAALLRLQGVPARLFPHRY